MSYITKMTHCSLIKSALCFTLCLQLHLEAKKQEGSLEALRAELEQSQQDKHEKVCAADILQQLLLFSSSVDIRFKHIMCPSYCDTFPFSHGMSTTCSMYYMFIGVAAGNGSTRGQTNEETGGPA